MKPIYLDLDNPITKAVLPLKQDAVDRAENVALNAIDDAYQALAAGDWDLDRVAPSPDSLRCSRAGYRAAISLRDFYQRLTKHDDDRWDALPADIRYGRKAPYYVQPNPEGAAAFVKAARDDAAFQYDKFVVKLCGKCGAVADAALEGSHVWGHSYLTVTKADGSTELWKTQMIVNRSVLNTLFNQFPTRRVKCRA